MGKWRRWAVVGLLTLASIISWVDRGNLSVALIDADFKNFFRIGNVDRGLVNSAFFWSYSLLQIPAGWLVDRYGSKYPVLAGFTVWSVLTAVTAFTTGFYSLFAVRLLLGVGESVLHVASMRWIRFNFAERRRGLAIGIFMSGSKYGPAIGAMLSAWLIDRFGWRAMFLLLGLVALTWIVPFFFLADDRDTDGTAAQAPADSGSQADMGGLLTNPIIWGTVIGTFCYMYFVYFCLTWMPAYLNEARGLSLDSSSLFTSFPFAGMATVAILGGLAADWLIGRGHDAVKVRKAFTIAGFLMASTELVGAYSTSLNVALFFFVFSLSGLGLATANYWALTQTLLPGAAIGRIVGIQNFAANLPGVVAPIITGWLVEKTGTFTAPLEAVLAALVVGVAAYLFLVRERYAPMTDRVSRAIR
jgi:MFS family permease